MPIKDLENLRGFPFIGDIRKGSEQIEKERDGKKYNVVGRDLDYFRVTFRRGYEHLKPIFDAHYGDKPTMFQNVFMDGDSPDTTFDYWLVERTKTKVIHKCNGEVQSQRWDAATAEYLYDNATCAKVDGSGCNCVRSGVLKILLGDFFNVTGIWGVFLVHTSSFNDIANIIGYLKKQQRILGTLFQVPFVLSRVAESIVVPNTKGKKGDKVHKDSHLLRLEVDPGFTKNWAALQFTQRPYQIRDGLLDTSSGELIQIPAHASREVSQLEEFSIADVEYDLDYAKEMTSHLFPKGPSHQDNAIAILRKQGLITPDMDTDQVIKVIKENRHNRNNEKFGDGTFWEDQELVKQFCGAVNLATGLTGEQIKTALNADFQNAPKANLRGFKGMSKSHAWALCLVYHRGGFTEAIDAAEEMPDVIAEIETMQRLTDLPF